MPFTILNNSTISPLYLLYFNVGKFKAMVCWTVLGLIWLLFSALVPAYQHQLIFLGTIHYWHILNGTWLMIYTKLWNNFWRYTESFLQSREHTLNTLNSEMGVSLLQDQEYGIVCLRHCNSLTLNSDNLNNLGLGWLWCENGLHREVIKCESAEARKQTCIKCESLIRKISHFIHRFSQSIVHTFALFAKSASSSTPIHKVQLTNLLASFILLLFN